MNTKTFGALAACIAGFAALLCGISVVLEMPMPVEIAMVAAALVLLAVAGGFIGAAVAAQKRSAAHDE